ncbi:hypothetical protein [Sphingomonas sp.]|nr:hypothetical protein [Sphingomonas sp.]
MHSARTKTLVARSIPIVVDAAYVDRELASTARNTDLSRFVF